MKKVITPAALKHIFVPFFAIILIFCNNFNFINADTSGYQSISGVYSQDGINYIGAATITGYTYTQESGTEQGQIAVTCKIAASALVNGAVTWGVYVSIDGVVGNMVTGTTVLSNGYGEATIYVDATLAGSVLLTSFSMTAAVVSSITSLDVETESLSDYYYSISETGVYSSSSASSYDLTTASTTANIIELVTDATLEDNSLLILKIPYGYGGYGDFDLYNLYQRNSATASWWTMLIQDSIIIPGRIYTYIIVKQSLYFRGYNRLGISITFNTGVLNYSGGSDTACYVIPIESEYYEVYNQLIYQRNIYDQLEDLVEETTTIADNTETIISNQETHTSWLTNIYNKIVDIYNFLVDGTDTETTDQIDQTVSDLQSASSTVESTQTDFTDMLNQYSSGVDLDDYDFESSSSYSSAATYYKYLISQTYNNTGELKYLIIIPLILAVFCFVIGVV